MLRRLLTCLAIITGLAAIGAPANAAVVEAISEQVGSASTVQQPGQSAQRKCVAIPDSNPAKGEPVQTCKIRKPVVIYIPTVQIGPDRLRQ